MAMVLSTRTRRGFTLLEMALVIAVIALLVGIVMGGQAIKRSNELRGVLSGASTYSIAIQQFRDKYDALPGDYAQATRVWGTDPNCAGTYTGTDSNPGTCNGNGDNYLTAGATGSSSCETFQLWKQLALAGFIQGNFTGYAGPAVNHHAIPGVNQPAGEITNTGYFAWSWPASYVLSSPAITAQFYPEYDVYDNVIVFGGAEDNNWSYKPSLTGNEAASLDQKGDDGLPATGDIRTFTNFWYSTLTVTCTTTATVPQYTKGNDGTGCTMIFLDTFNVRTK